RFLRRSITLQPRYNARSRNWTACSYAPRTALKTQPRKCKLPCYSRCARSQRCWWGCAGSWRRCLAVTVSRSTRLTKTKNCSFECSWNGLQGPVSRELKTKHQQHLVSFLRSQVLCNFGFEPLDFGLSPPAGWVDNPNPKN